eukprot:c36502_g1_i1 orf=75-323(+)
MHDPYQSQWVDVLLAIEVLMAESHIYEQLRVFTHQAPCLGSTSVCQHGYQMASVNSFHRKYSAQIVGQPTLAAQEEIACPRI